MRFEKILSVALSASLVVAFAPQAALAQGADENDIAQQEAAQLDETLAAGDYVQGQAIVVVDTSVTDAVAAGARNLIAGEDLLDGAQDVMDATGSAFTAATGQRQTTDVQVKCVTSSTLSTKELISKLLDDPRVISAEPNVEVDASALEDADGTQNDSDASATAAKDAAKMTAKATPVKPASSSDATNITGTSSMPDLTSYQWYASSSAGTMKQPGTSSNSSLDVPTWNEKSNASDAVVALIDSGVNYDHPDIQPNMMDMTQYNAGTKYEGVAGKYGYNPAGWDYDSTSDPMDEEGHGTHVAGIMCANWDGKGTSGVVGGAKLVAVKIMAGESYSFLSCLKGYEYLSTMVDKGLNLTAVNNSWAGQTASPSVCLAMTKLGQKGVVSVIASGNEGKDISKAPYSTSSFATSPYTVVVNSSNIRGEQSDFSNYGAGVTDVYAPGSSILSTYKTSYLPYADPTPAYYEDFSSKEQASKVIVRKLASSDALPFSDGELVSSYTDEASFDAGTGSLGISLSADAKESQSFEILIPVTQDQVKAASYLGITACGRGDMRHVTFDVGVASKKGKAYYSGETSGAYCNTWVGRSLDLSSAVQCDDSCAGIAVKDGYMSVRVDVTADGEDVTAKGANMLYIDCIGLGSNVCDYDIEHGTSMATPCTTASAAIIATQLKAQGASGEQLVKAVIRTIKGSVIQSDEMRAVSTAGGHLSFKMLDVDTPVIEDYQQDGDTITLTGVGFGKSAGTGKIGKEDAKVKSWSESQVELEIPNSVASGAYSVQLANANGQTGSVCASLTTSGTSLYEKTIALPGKSNGPAGSPYTCMAKLGSKIYVLCSSEFGDSVAYRQFYSYDVKSGEWTRLARLPYTKAAKASMTVYKGNVIVACGATLNRGALMKNNALYSYSPSENSWTKLAGGKKLPYATALVRFGGKLLCVGGMQSDEWGSLESTKGIFQFNLRKQTLTKLGTLASSCDTTLQASVSSGTLYVSNGSAQDITSTTIEKKLVNAFKWEGGKLVRYKMGKALPKAAKGYLNTYGAAATPAGLVVSGYPAKASGGAKSVHDSYLLTLGEDGAVTCKELDKSFSYNTALQLTSIYCKGWLYTLGAAYDDDMPMLMRATKL